MRFFSRNVIQTIIKIFALLLVFSLFSCFDFFSKDKDKDTDPIIAAPTGVTATDGIYYSQIVIEWNSVSNADTYNVYRSQTNGNWTFAGAIDASYTSAYDSVSDLSGSITAGTTYYYCVTAVDSDENESAYSSSDTGYASTTKCTIRFGNHIDSTNSITEIRVLYSFTGDPSCNQYDPSSYGDDLLVSNLLPNYYIDVNFPDYAYIDWYFENSQGEYGYDDSLNGSSSKWGSDEMKIVVINDYLGQYGYVTSKDLEKSIDNDIMESITAYFYDPAANEFKEIPGLNKMEN